MLKKYIIPIWYFVTLIFTGALLLPHFIWQGAGDYSISFTQFGPLFATLLLLKLKRDESTVLEIKNGLRFSTHNTHWYALAALIPIALTGISAFVLTAFFDSQYHAWSGTPVFYILNLAAMLLGSIGEEIGWRGYLLPSLNKKASPFVSSIIVGFLWGLWHLHYAGDIAFWLLFIITTIELSIILTFLLNRAYGNLWTSIILHTFFNLANRMFVWERFNMNLLLIETVVFGLACAIVLVLDRKSTFQKSV